MGWVSPTGFNDPDNGWTSEARVYDEDTGTKATSAYVDIGVWTKKLELTHAALDCNKIQFYGGCGSSGGHSTSSWEWEAYYDGAWHLVSTTRPARLAWSTITFSVGTKSITKVRFRAKQESGSWPFYANELDFWEVEVTAPTVTTQDATGIGFD